MPRLFQDDPRDSGPANASLTTADLAHANDRTSTFNDVADDVAMRHVNRDRTTFNQQEASFSDQSEEDDASLDRSDLDTINDLDTRAANARSTSPANRSEDGAAATPLFTVVESNDFHARWNSVQTGFVDEPRRAVQQADALVAGAMQRLAEIFAEERSKLDKQWDRGDSVSTEDLRLALQRYRSFFGRLLSI